MGQIRRTLTADIVAIEKDLIVEENLDFMFSTRGDESAETQTGTGWNEARKLWNDSVGHYSRQQMAILRRLPAKTDMLIRPLHIFRYVISEKAIDRQGIK